MMQTPPFSCLLYKTARIIQDVGGGAFSIPIEDEIMVLEVSGRIVRPRHVHMHEDPPVLPVEDELPMDPYNMELRSYQDDIGHGSNLTNITLEYMMSHMNIPCNDSFPDYPHIRTWEDRWSTRQSGAGGSGAEYGGGY